MAPRPHAASAARPLGVLGLALSGLLLMGFHSVVSGALQQAESQRALSRQLADAEAPCLSLSDSAQRQLCILRLESGRTQSLAAAP
jgi:hypothetical protein